MYIGAKGTCPHCRTAVVYVVPPAGRWDFELSAHTLEGYSQFQAGTSLHVLMCPACNDYVVDRIDWQGYPGSQDEQTVSAAKRLYPPPASFAFESPDVPQPLRAAYLETRSVLHSGLSARASALLARSCLQQLLREQGWRARTLDEEIKLAQADPRVTTALGQQFHVVRNVGNYAAHPTADASGDFLTVEPGEAEALLGAIEHAFDVFYIKPAAHRRLVDAINAKLRNANKPEIE